MSGAFSFFFFCDANVSAAAFMFPFNQGRIRPRKTGLNRDYLRCALSTDWNQTLLHSFMLKPDCSSQQSKQSLVTWQLEANFADMEVAQQPRNQKYPINQLQPHLSIIVLTMECLELWLKHEAESMRTDRSLLLIPLHLSFNTVEKKLCVFFFSPHDIITGALVSGSEWDAMMVTKTE